MVYAVSKNDVNLVCQIQTKPSGMEERDRHIF